MSGSVPFKHLPTILALALMTGVAIESFSRPRAIDAEPYHHKILLAARNSEFMPTEFGDWRSQDRPVVQEAQQLLRPNVMIERVWENRQENLAASFLLVQCQDARDMGGHYPPICYPAQGYTREDAAQRSWTVDGRKISGTTYTFLRADELHTVRICVDSILIVPGRGIVQNYEEIRGAAADLARRAFGAAQIQVVHDGSADPEQRDRATIALLRANIKVIDAIIDADNQGGTP